MLRPPPLCLLPPLFLLLRCFFIFAREIPPMGNHLQIQPENGIVPVCPCSTGCSTPCMSYDSRRQASSMAEALYMFPDLGTYDPTGGTPVYQANMDPANRVIPMDPGYSCETKDCQGCMLNIVSMFAANTGNRSDWFHQTADQLRGRGVNDFQCRSPHMANTHPRAGDSNGPNQGQWLSNDMVNSIVQAMQPDTGTMNQRAKQQQNSNGFYNREPPLLGIAIQLGCDYRRGNAISDSQWVGLCNICWQWRRLPDGYFPLYINEVNCDIRDNTCLAGFALCRPILRTLDVLKNYGTNMAEQWHEETIYTLVGCECQVEIGTPLQTFVTR